MARIHHLNCGTMCPATERLINGGGSLLARGKMVCHCWLVESDDGLILVDTGLGLEDVADAASRLGRPFVLAGRPRLDPAETAVRQVEALGYRAADVRHLVITHLDLDHAGGLPDFPEATVHVFETEHEAAMRRSTRKERMRYCPDHWKHGPKWKLYREDGERWFGFPRVRAVGEVDPEVLLVPLPGHTRGHCGVAVRTDAGWLLHCGDAYFHHRALDPDGPPVPLGLRLFEREVQIDGALRRQNLERLRELARDPAAGVILSSAHDPADLDRLRARD